jgi:hypothetical protein
LFGSQTEPNYSILSYFIKIMKKIVAILSVASLFSATCVSAQRVVAAPTPAAPTNVVVGGGVVPQICKIDSVVNGTLKLAAGSVSKLVTDTAGKVNVTCNTTTSKLEIAVNSASSTVYNGTASTQLNGGTGVYSTAGAAGAGPLTSVSPGAIVNGNSAYVEATIDAGTAPLQAATNYGVTVDTTLTP